MKSIKRSFAVIALVFTFISSSALIADTCSSINNCPKMNPGNCTVTSPIDGYTLCYTSGDYAVCRAYDANGYQVDYDYGQCSCYSFCDTHPWRCAPQCL